MKQSYVLDTGVLLNLVRGKELGSRIDREFGLSRAPRLHTISIVTHGELKVLADRNDWGSEKRNVLAIALDNLVTINIESEALVEAYVKVAEPTCVSANVPRLIKEARSEKPVRHLSRTLFTVEYTVERGPHMETVQVVLDKSLLQATDKAARQRKQNRSALIREALREHLTRLAVLSSEERDQAGYRKHPQAVAESCAWEAEAAWPAE